MSKKGRKKLREAPPLDYGVPEERALFAKCTEYLLTGTFPNQEEYREFLVELMWRYVNLAKPKRYTGIEIAAMVDFWARQKGSIEKGLREVRKLVGNSFSDDAIKQHHKRYGKRLSVIKKQHYVSWLGFPRPMDGDDRDDEAPVLSPRDLQR